MISAHTMSCPLRKAAVLFLLGGSLSTLASCAGPVIPVTPMVHDAGSGAAPSIVVDSPGDEPDDENDQNEDVTAPPVGALPNTMEYYSTNGDKFYAHFQGMPWHGHKRARKCQGCTDPRRTTLRIQALSNQQKQRLTGLAANGVVVGRIRNVGSDADLTTGIQGKGWLHKPDEYYFIITDKNDSRAAHLWVAHVTFSLKYFKWKPDTAMMITEAKHDFLKCHDSSYTSAKSDGDFAGCSRSAFIDPTDAIAWFSCDGGCCTAQWSTSAGLRDSIV